MKKHLSIGISLFLSFAFLLTACGSNNGSPALDSVSPPSNAMQTDTLEASNNEWVYLSDFVDSDGMNLYWQLENFQFTADENAILSLYVKADKDDDGGFIFDDGQDWLLVMKTSLGYYELFQRQYLQLGKVFVTVYNGWNDESKKYDITNVLVTVEQGAGHKIYNLIFNNELKAFRIESILDVQNINFMGRSD